MKKLNNNNKFRGNNGNTIYSLNYKFDSVSSAGKLSGTALDLIKKYNELAKEAHNNGDYVQMEVFRQYAEHYRKIVTEINERKNQNRDNQSAQQTADNGENAENKQEENTNLVETEAAALSAQAAPEAETEAKPVEKPKRRRSFTVIDVAAKENNAENAETVTEQSAEPASEETTEAEQAEKPRRRVLTRRRTIKPTAENTEAEQNG